MPLRSQFHWLVLITSAGLAIAGNIFPATNSLAADFTDVTLSSGINYLQGGPAAFPMSGGAAAGDYDNDGWVDLLVSRYDDGPILYRNKGDGTFEDVSNASILGETLQRSNGLAWGDVNNDGHLDFSATTVATGEYALYINDGTGKFNNEAVPRNVDLTGPDLPLGQSTSFGDYDNDGYLDLFVTEWKPSFVNPTVARSRNRLFRNQGASNPGYYEDVTDLAGVSMENYVGTFGVDVGPVGFTPRFTDLDGDGDSEIFIAGDYGMSRLFWNNGDGTFSDRTHASGIGSGDSDMGLTSADYDRDGDIDLFITAIHERPDSTGLGSGNRLLQNNGDGTFTRVDDLAGVNEGGWGWGTDFLDYDNDGFLDIAMTNGQVSSGDIAIDQSVLFASNGDGTFSDVSTDAGITDNGSGKGLLRFDYDNDGDQDLFIVNNAGAPVLYRNDVGNLNDWLRIDLEGSLSHPDGIGALIKVYPDLGDDPLVWEVSASSTYLAQSEITAHFGLGASADQVDLIEIHWPSQVIQSIENIQPNTQLTVVEDVNFLVVPEPASLSLTISGVLGLLIYSLYLKSPGRRIVR